MTWAQLKSMYDNAVKWLKKIYPSIGRKASKSVTW